MNTIALDDFTSFVGTLHGRTLYTLARNRPFTVVVTEKGFEYTPQSTNAKRLHRFPRVRIYLETFARTGSLEGNAYHGGSNQSYVLALMNLYKDRYLDR